MKRYIWIVCVCIALMCVMATAFASEEVEATDNPSENETEAIEETATPETDSSPTPETTSTPTPTPQSTPKPTIEVKPITSVSKPEIKPVYGFDPRNSLSALTDSEEVAAAIESVFEANGADGKRIAASAGKVDVSNRRVLISALDSAQELSGMLAGWYNTNFLIKDTTNVTRAEFCHILDAINSILGGQETPSRVWGSNYTQVYRIVELFKFPHGAMGTQFVPSIVNKAINTALRVEVTTWVISDSKTNKVPAKFSYVNPQSSLDIFILSEAAELQLNADGTEGYTGYGTSYGGIGENGMYLHVTLPAQ